LGFRKLYSLFWVWGLGLGCKDLGLDFRIQSFFMEYGLWIMHQGFRCSFFGFMVRGLVLSLFLEFRDEGVWCRVWDFGLWIRGVWFSFWC